MLHRTFLLSLTTCVFSVIPAAAEPPAEKPEFTFEFHRAETASAEGLKEAEIRDGKQKVYLHPKAEVTLADVKEVVASKDQNSDRSAVSITLTKSGAKKMRTLTEGHRGKPLAIVVNGEVVLAPTVKETLASRIMISGLKPDETEELVKLFRDR